MKLFIKKQNMNNSKELKEVIANMIKVASLIEKFIAGDISLPNDNPRTVLHWTKTVKF